LIPARAGLDARPAVWRIADVTDRKDRKRKRRLARYIALRWVEGILRLLPQRIALAAGAAAGRLASGLVPRERKVGLENLARAFPDRDDAWRKRTYRSLLGHFGRNLVLLLHVSRRWPAGRDRWVDGVDDLEERIRQATGGGRGAIIVSGHIGNWELLAGVLATLSPGKFLALGREIRDERANRLLVRLRESLGAQTHYQADYPRPLLELLRNGGLVGILPDQDVKNLQGTFVDFFGVPAWTPTGPAALARAARVPMLPVFLVGEGGRFRTVIGEPIEVGREGGSEALTKALSTWTRFLEETIRRYPDQWAWFHRRWRTRPEDVPAGQPETD